MRLKIIALFTGIVSILLCMLSGLKINPIHPAALFQTATPAGGFGNAPLRLTSTPAYTQAAPTATQTATPIPTEAVPTDSPTPEITPIVIYAAGDIAACYNKAPDQSTGAMITSNMLVDTSGPIFTLGDDSNEGGTKKNYDKCYNPTWGRLLDRTYPVMGNHDRGPDINGTAFFAYFAGRTGVWGHYSLDLGTWHIVILNAQCGIGGQNCRIGSAQEKWLKADLAATRQKCIMALWHQPLFTSGNEPRFPTAKSFWSDLYAVKADIILNGHNHLYERFFPLDPYGAAAADGMREFVVGTGGAFLDPPISAPVYGEMVRNASTYGYLKLTLFADSYEWQFVPQAGQSFTDSGAANCHR
jgi:alkaline phosphatase